MTDEQLDDLISRMGSVISAFTFNRLKTILTELRDRIETGGGGGGGSTDASDIITGILSNDRLQDIPQSKIVNLVADLASKAAAVHTHTTSQVTGLDAALATKSPTTHTHSTSDVNGLDSALSGKAALSHTHSTSQVTGLDAALAAKAPTDHTHLVENVTGLQAALDAKAPTSHTHTAAQIQDFNSAVQTAAPAETASQIKDKLETLSGTARLDASAIKNLPSGGGTGAVESVNGQQGIVSLNQDNISDGTTYKQYSQTDKTKLGGIATGATANSTDAALRDRATHTGTQAIATVTGLQTALDGKVATDGAKVLSDVNFTTAKDTKLTGIATGATANSSDATLLARANHTGTQLAATISDFQTAVGANTKLAGIATGATANATDAALRDRSTHTGTQLASTISNFNAAALAAAPAETATTLGAVTTSAAEKIEIIDADSVGFTDSAASSIWKKVSFANIWRWIMRNLMAWFGWYNVKYYGATGVGDANNDTAAFQNCINAAILNHGKVIIPSPVNFYNITSTIQVYPNASSTGADEEVTVDIEATGTPQYIIRYSGASGTSCFDITGLRFSKWSGVSVKLADTTNLIGFDCDTKTPGGSFSFNTFNNCNVVLGNATGQKGWRLGHVSSNGGDISCLLWLNSLVYGAGKSVAGAIGWHVEGGNTLQLVWNQSFSAYCDKMYSNVSGAGATGTGNGSAYFYGMGASQNNLDFEIGNNQSYFISGRFESGERFLHVANSNVSPSVTLQSVEINDYTPADGILFYLDMPCFFGMYGVNIQTGPTATEYTASMIRLEGGGGGTGRGRMILDGGSYEAANPCYTVGGTVGWDIYVRGVGRQNSTGVNFGLMTDLPVAGGGATTNASLLTSGTLSNDRLSNIPASKILASDTQTLDLTTLASVTEAKTEIISVALSDLTTAITVGTNKAYFRMPFAGTLTAVKATALTAPTGSTMVIDINEAGVSVLSTKLSIDASEKTSATAATAAVISDLALANDAEITFDFDQVGSTIAGAGVIVYLTVVRA